MKARYLTFFSYIGTPFRSSEKIWAKEGRNYPDPQSVQGMMELALLKLRSLNYPNVVLSSRTDGGVHALKNSAHFDLERYGSRIYEPRDILYSMNKYFFKTGTSITIKKCLRVADNFHARFHAIRRTYLYRLAVLKPDVEVPDRTGLGSLIPIEELRRCDFLRLNDFDITRFEEGSRYFVGYHDFCTFKKFNKENSHKHCRREILAFRVSPGRPLVTRPGGNENCFDYWDIEVQGRGFVHNQIRRMVGALISVGIGKLPPEEIKVMLQVPSKHSWYSFIQSGPPDGLYLCNVEYNPEHLVYTEPIQHAAAANTEEIISDSDCE